MNVLVTGGAGFIGSHVCERLIAEGHFVDAVDDFSLGRKENLDGLADNDHFRLMELDVTDEPGLAEMFAGRRYQTVFHLAANSDIARSRERPDTDFEATFLTTYRVLEQMRRNDVREIVFASSSAIYGEVTGPIPESFGPLRPISHYGAAKLASEAFISSFAHSYGMRAWMPRFPNVVGERLTHGAIYDFAARLAVDPERLVVLGNGCQVKPYLHVSDLVSAVLLAWREMKDTVNIVNIAGATRATVRRMAEIVVAEAGGGAEIIFGEDDRGWVGDVPAVDFDTSVIRELGWQPELDSEAAVAAAARWAVGHSG